MALSANEKEQLHSELLLWQKTGKVSASFWPLINKFAKVKVRRIAASSAVEQDDVMGDFLLALVELVQPDKAKSTGKKRRSVSRNKK